MKSFVGTVIYLENRDVKPQHSDLHVDDLNMSHFHSTGHQQFANAETVIFSKWEDEKRVIKILKIRH